MSAVVLQLQIPGGIAFTHRSCNRLRSSRRWLIGVALYRVVTNSDNADAAMLTTSCLERCNRSRNPDNSALEAPAHNRVAKFTDPFHSKTRSRALRHFTKSFESLVTLIG